MERRRPTAEIAQAHDLLWHEIMDPRTRAQLDEPTLRSHFVMARTLCWALGHEGESPLIDDALESILDLTVAVSKAGGASRP